MQKVVNVSKWNVSINERGEYDFAGVINRVLRENENLKLESIYPILGELGTERLLVVFSDESQQETELLKQYKEILTEYSKVLTR